MRTEARGTDIGCRSLGAPVGLPLLRHTPLKIVPKLIGRGKGITSPLFIGRLLKDIRDRYVLRRRDIVHTMRCEAHRYIVTQ